jgi:hypothetical protein
VKLYYSIGRLHSEDLIAQDLKKASNLKKRVNIAEKRQIEVVRKRQTDRDIGALTKALQPELDLSYSQISKGIIASRSRSQVRFEMES